MPEQERDVILDFLKEKLLDLLDLQESHYQAGHVKWAESFDKKIRKAHEEWLAYLQTKVTQS